MSDDDIGYGKPPKHSRWRKGQSGNPRGRPKRSPDVHADLIAELNEIIQITEGGVSKRITKQRALFKALMTGGIKGDVRAASTLIGMAARHIEAGHGTPDPDISAAEQKMVEDYLNRQVELRLAQKKGEA